MQRSSALILPVVALAALAAAWLVAGWSGPGPPPPAPAEGEPSAVVTPHVAPPDGVTAGSLPPGAITVRLQVVLRERYQPPPPPLVQAARPDGRPLAVQVLAGASAGFDPDGPRQGAALARIEIDGGAVLRQVEVGAGAAVVGARLLQRGRVETADGRPLSGALVWFGELLADGAPREVGTDDEGGFEVDVPAGAGVPFVVRAPGFASQWRPVGVTAPPAELVARLQPAGELLVQIAGAATGIASARVVVAPGAAAPTDLLQWPFFVQALDGGWPVDERGQCTISGLPRSGDIDVHVLHPLAPLGAPASGRLGEITRIVAPVRVATALWHGVVTDEFGAPLGDVQVFARRPGQRLGALTSARLLPPQLGARGIGIARTATDGSFAIAAADAADGMLSLRAADRAGRDLLWHTVSDAAIRLPLWRGGDAAVVLLPPVAGAPFRVESDLAGGLVVDTAAGATCRLALPTAGAYDFVAAIHRDGREPAIARWSDVAVTGAVELPLPPPQ